MPFAYYFLTVLFSICTLYKFALFSIRLSMKGERFSRFSVLTLSMQNMYKQDLVTSTSLEANWRSMCNLDKCDLETWNSICIDLSVRLGSSSNFWNEKYLHIQTYQTLSSSAHAEGVGVAAAGPIMHHLIHEHHLPCFLWLAAQFTLAGLCKRKHTHTSVHPGIFRIWRGHLLRSLQTYHLGAHTVARCAWCFCGICCSSGRTAEHGSPRKGQRTPLCCTSGSQKQSQGNLDHRRQAWARTKWSPHKHFPSWYSQRSKDCPFGGNSERFWRKDLNHYNEVVETWSCLIQNMD